jgi:hypothetical protein
LPPERQDLHAPVRHIQPRRGNQTHSALARNLHSAGGKGVPKGVREMLILLIVLLLILGAGGGYYGHSRWGYSGGAGIGLGTVLLILLVAWLLGVFH